MTITEHLVAAKQGPCRVCGSAAENGRLYGLIKFHLVVPHAHSGEDVADNIVPLCPDCEERVTALEADTCCLLVWNLTATEYRYAVDRVGPNVWQLCYGIRYQR